MAKRFFWRLIALRMSEMMKSLTESILFSDFFIAVYLLTSIQESCPPATMSLHARPSTKPFNGSMHCLMRRLSSYTPWLRTSSRGYGPSLYALAVLLFILLPSALQFWNWVTFRLMIFPPYLINDIRVFVCMVTWMVFFFPLGTTYFLGNSCCSLM